MMVFHQKHVQEAHEPHGLNIAFCFVNSFTQLEQELMQQYHKDPKAWVRQSWANSVDPDQTAQSDIRATTWQNQQSNCVPSEDSDQPGHWLAKGPRFLHADSEDSDQTGWMPRLIWVFAGHTLTLLVLSCHGS